MGNTWSEYKSHNYYIDISEELCLRVNVVPDQNPCKYYGYVFIVKSDEVEFYSNAHTCIFDFFDSPQLKKQGGTLEEAANDFKAEALRLFKEQCVQFNKFLNNL
jgi:hypothetical protein